jgi:hypothetical protein
MGASIPVFARVCAAHGTSLAGLYGINTLGAAAGVLVNAFALVPWLGLARSGWLVASLNLGVFAATRVIERSASTAPEPRPAAPPRLPAPGRRRLATGFATFALEVAWFRSLRAAFLSSTDSFAIMLFAVLLALGAGARLAPWLRRLGAEPGLLLGAAAVAILAATPVVERMDMLATSQDGYAALVTRRALLALAALGRALLLLGSVLPWLLEEYRDAAAPAGCMPPTRWARCWAPCSRPGSASPCSASRAPRGRSVRGGAARWTFAGADCCRRGRRRRSLAALRRGHRPQARARHLRVHEAGRARVRGGGRGDRRRGLWPRRRSEGQRPRARDRRLRRDGRGDAERELHGVDGAAADAPAPRPAARPGHRLRHRPDGQRGARGGSRASRRRGAQPGGPARPSPRTTACWAIRAGARPRWTAGPGCAASPSATTW